MKRILNYLNDLTLDQNTERLIGGELETGLILNQVSQFNRLSPNEQNTYMLKLTDRIKQITKPYKLLTVLCLIDNILKTNTEVDLPPLTFPSLKQDTSKEHIILVNIINYYHRFMHLSYINRYNKFTLNAQEELEEAENYCELSIQKILEFIKVDFLFSNAWSKLVEHRMLLKEVVGSILDRFRQDLGIVNTFVKNNIELVLQKTVIHPLVFHINHVYEQLICINRELKKITNIAQIYNQTTQFPRYEVDVELNRQIELEMLERKDEKKQFYENRAKAESIMKKRDCNCFVEDVDQGEVFIRTSQSFLLLGEDEQQ